MLKGQDDSTVELFGTDDGPATDIRCLFAFGAMLQTAPSSLKPLGTNRLLCGGSFVYPDEPDAARADTAAEDGSSS